MTAAGRVPDGRVPGYLGRVLDGGGDPVGTCFQVVPGVLVTAWHVLEDIGAADEDARVGVDPLAGGEAFEATVARLDRVHDLAVLVCDIHLPATAGAAGRDGPDGGAGGGGGDGACVVGGSRSYCPVR